MRIGIALAAAAFACSGCATVVRGAKDDAKFESEPAGATVTVESISSDKLGPFDCKTPCELELKRKREWNVVFMLDGHKPATGTLKPKVTGGGVASGAGNIIAGGIIGIGVDAGTGANLDLRPNPMKARLAPVDSANDSTILSEDQLEAEEKAAESARSTKGAPASATIETAAADERAAANATPSTPDATSGAPEPQTTGPVDPAADAVAPEVTGAPRPKN